MGVMTQNPVTGTSEWREEFPDTPEGQQAAQDSTNQRAMSGPGGPSNTGGNPVQNQGSANDLNNAIEEMWRAANELNVRDFGEKVRQFDQTFGLDRDRFAEDTRRWDLGFPITQAGLTGTYQGQPTTPALTSYASQFGTWGVPRQGQQTLAAQNQAIAQAQAEAGLTGYYTNPSALQYRPGTFVGNTANGGLGYVLPNGQISPIGSMEHFQALGGDPSTIASLPKLSPEQWQALVNAPPGGAGRGMPTMAREAQTFGQGLSAITTAAGLQANPFRQAQVIGQLGGLLRGTGVAGFQAPGQAQGQSDFSGLGNMQRLIDDIRGGPNAINSQSTQSVLDAIPTPNKLDSVNFARSSPLTQNMVLQGMQEKYGLSPDDALAQIKNTLPQFQSPTTFGGTVRR